MKAKNIIFKAPEGMTGISHGGESYDAVDGKFVLPGDADIQVLAAIGVLPIGSEGSDEPEAATEENAGAGDDQGAANTSAPAEAAGAPIAPPWASKE